MAVVPIVVGILLVTFLNEDTLDKKILPTYSAISFGGSDTEIFLEKTSAILEENRSLQMQAQQYAQKATEVERQKSELNQQLLSLQNQTQVINELKKSSDERTEQLEFELKKLEDQMDVFKTTAASSSTPEQLLQIEELEKKLLELETSQNQTDMDSIFEQLSGFEQEIVTPTLSKPPVVEMTDEIISWSFLDSKNNNYSFSKVTSQFIDEVIKLPESQDVIPIDIASGTVQVRDLSKFVVGSMSKVMNELYGNVGSDDEFIFEVWFVVSQFHVTSFEMQNDPKKPLDTFSKGEGDNEDLAILFADMIKSSTAGKDWQVKFLYFDSDNISLPQKINHVVLVIDNGKNVWVIEPTAKTIDEAFESRDRIRGHVFTID
ncbi:hypothetical protein C5F50_08120 [Nitrosopumilus ureiphilus]|uniref:Uncharacterized protein n=1 Tax=Nitrosopumilus ureiphilus TaxID=1470067 RepID=A0A7D5R205_9ARCH|nr:hypothetical protein C5F50_08120 [Nitrosopumilus ureiphilus]